MQQAGFHGARTAPIVVGGALVLVGLAAFALQGAGVDVGQAIGDGGWPFFVILPGLALLAASFAVTPPRGVGFAIAGSIVTTVGLILLYQNTTDNWQSWAYAWALIPTAAGVGMLGYGELTNEPRITGTGARLAVIGAVLFGVGLWFFGPIFDLGRPPIDLGDAWPLVFVVGGVLLVGAALLNGGRDPNPPQT
jgi:hypothetical protein